MTLLRLVVGSSVMILFATCCCYSSSFLTVSAWQQQQPLNHARWQQQKSPTTTATLVSRTTSSRPFSAPSRWCTVHFPSAAPNEHLNSHDDEEKQQQQSCRRGFLDQLATTAIAATTAFATTDTLLFPPAPAHALVKGVAPPPPKKSGGGDKPKCTNLDECEALREKQEDLERQAALANAVPIQKTAGGTRYRDMVEDDEGSTTKTENAVVVKEGDEVTLYYKVLKLGKRSYDGLSGEGTVVFSRGYGFEDDEKGPGMKSFTTVVGSVSNIAALNEALVGMTVGGPPRRFAVLPQKGWRQPTAQCDGGPGGSGAGGDIKTDFVVVPTAQLVAEEACFDMTKQPFPTTYAQQRRMAQRFDQSLIMEVQVVSAK